MPGPDGIACRLQLSHDADRDDALARCRAALDLDADTGVIDGHLAADPILRPLVERAPGIRVPGAFDPTEAAVRAVLGQQVSVKGARTLAARLVERCGRRLERPRAGMTHTFPTAAAIAQADLSGLGMPGSRVRALAGLATALADGSVSLAPGSDAAATHAALISLPGIGEWTASYICMRALKDPDAFPAGDLGVARGAAALGLPTSRRALVEASERWRPWRAYAVMHLWSVA
jgi:AraC family transcriptional regulator of adaptative response / DNA-3-methyladenine glycosylase II